MSRDRYKRTTTASRRATRKVRYLHVSRTFAVSPTGKVTMHKGRTCDYRRNEWKRLRRAQAGHHTAERASRIAYIEQCWREGKFPRRADPKIEQALLTGT